MLTEFAPAKLNLALHVRARRPDGYHELETLFAFCDLGDRLTAEPAEGLSLAVTGRFGEGLSAGEDNLVLRAARMLGTAIGAEPRLAIRLHKALPVASGIGGGSADAAATLRLVARAAGLDRADPRLMACARALGSDVPACLLGRTAFGRGRGEALAPRGLGDLEGAPLILANPGVAVPTGPVFAGWDGVDHGALGDDPLAGRNDLTAPAIALAPVIADLLDVMAATRPIVARMSGSGATCFAIYRNEQTRDRALLQLRDGRPGAWIEPAALI